MTSRGRESRRQMVSKDVYINVIYKCLYKYNADNSPPTVRSSSNLNERHTKYNTSVLGESQTLNVKYSSRSYFDNVEMIINNVKYIMTSK